MRFITASLVLLSWALASCSGGGEDSEGGDEDGGDGDAGSPVEPACTATVDGAPFVGTTITISENHGGISVSCASADNTEGLVINSGALGEGESTVSLDGSVTQAWAQFTHGALHPEGGAAWLSASGSVTVDYNAGASAEGTFEFVGDDETGGTTKSVTGGMFAGNIE